MKPINVARRIALATFPTRVVEASIFASGPGGYLVTFGAGAGPVSQMYLAPDGLRELVLAGQAALAQGET